MPHAYPLPSAPPLLRTKILIPQNPPEYVHRPRLTARINRGIKGPLTLLCAPAGFGKTNLLTEWKETCACPTAWLTIDRDDNDLLRFFRYLVGAIQALDPAFGEETLGFFQSSRSAGVQMGLTLLTNELTARSAEMTLVLDEFQVLENAEILASLNFLLRYLPHQCHIILASRSEPGLDLALLRSRGQVVELNADDLRFTREEIGQFFHQSLGVTLPAETIRALEQRTDGWITAMQLTAISLQHQPDPSRLLGNPSGDSPYLVDYLAEEVLDRQPEEVRQFLLRSSILHSLTGSLCEAVVQPDAQPGYGNVMLSRLEHANLFITAVDAQHEWYRFHPIFADFLRQIQAEINPAELPTLYQRAALWCEKNGHLEESFQYALSSGDEEWTASLIERNIYTIIKTGEMIMLTRPVSKMSRDVLHRHTRIGLAYAWGLIAGYQLDLACEWLEDLQQSLDLAEQQARGTADADAVGADAAAADAADDNPAGSDPTSFWNIHGGLAICRAALALLSGDMEAAAQFTRLAANHLTDENPFVLSLLALEDNLYMILSGDTQKAIASLHGTVRLARQANNLLVMLIASSQLAEMQALQGQLSQAMATLQKAQYLVVDAEGKPLPVAGIIEIGIGEILYERDFLTEARASLEHGSQATRSAWWISSLDGMVTLARLQQAQGNIAASQAILSEASQMALSTESSRWDDVIVSAVAVRLALLRGDLPGAVQWWQRGGFPDYLHDIALSRYPYHVFEYLLLTQVRLLIKVGQDRGDAQMLAHALKLLEGLMTEALRFQRVTSQIEILVLQAFAHSALGSDQARADLLRALALGEPEGYRRIFLDEGPSLIPLLLQCAALIGETARSAYLPTHTYIQSLIDLLVRSGGRQSQPVFPLEPGRPITPVVDPESNLPVVLSARELEVLRLIAAGKSNQEIAAQLYLALNTVKRHAYNIYAKLDVKKRTHAVQKARQLGLIE